MTTTFLSSGPSTDQFIIEVAGAGTTMRASLTDSISATNPFTMTSVTVPASNSFMLCRGYFSPANGFIATGLTVPTSLTFGVTSSGSNKAGGFVGFGFVSSGTKNCTVTSSGASDADGTTVVFGAASSGTKKRAAVIY